MKPPIFSGLSASEYWIQQIFAWDSLVYRNKKEHWLVCKKIKYNSHSQDNSNSTASNIQTNEDKNALSTCNEAAFIVRVDTSKLILVVAIKIRNCKEMGNTFTSIPSS